MRRHVVTFEQVNRVYAAASRWAQLTGYPLMDWYRGACEYVTGMPEPQRPGYDAPQDQRTAYGMGWVGHIPEVLQQAAREACDVSDAELAAA